MSDPLVLRRDALVLRRRDAVLQVGLQPPCVLLDDDPAVVDLLDALEAEAGLAADVPLAPAAAAALDRLRAAGLVAPLVHDDDPVLLALQAQGADAVRRRQARRLLAVDLDGDEHLLDLHGETVADLMSAAGLCSPGLDSPVHPARVRLVLAGGVWDREVSDLLMREGVAHLVISGGAGGVRLGPLVVPGSTACVRCIDAHESSSDPRRPLLLAQAARAARRRPPLRDDLLDRWALTWAVRDLALLSEGEEPSTWSTTWDLAPTGAPSATRWGRHLDCGCAWGPEQPAITTRRSPAWPPSP